MTTLIVRGVPSPLNLFSGTKFTYNIVKYEMGSPDPESGGLCADTVTLTIASTNRLLMSRHVGVVYKSMSAAVDYYRHGGTPVYLEATVPGQSQPVYAYIESFQFHELGDPYDHTGNGNFIQDATLAISRTPWSNAGPQTSLLSVAKPGFQMAFEPITLEMISTIPSGGRDYGFTTPTWEKMVFIRNGYTTGHITSIYNSTGSTTNLQPVNWVAHALGNNADPNALTFYLGSTVTNYKSQFYAAVFDIDDPLVMPGGYAFGTRQMGVAYWDTGTAGWVATDALVDYTSLFGRAGDAVLKWANPGPAWGTTTINGEEGYYVRVQPVPAISAPNQFPTVSKRVYTPLGPWLDVPAGGGDMAGALRFVIRDYNSPLPTDPLLWEDYQDEYWDNDQIMTHLVVGSRRCTNPTVAPELWPGIFPLVGGDGLTLTLNAVTSAEAFSTLSTTMYAVRTTASTMTSGTIAAPLRIARLDMRPDKPASYRAFLRYYLSADGVGRTHFRLRATSGAAVAPAGVPGMYHTVPMDSTENRLFVADMGVVTPTAVHSVGTSYWTPFSLELEGYAETDTTGLIEFSDLILIPIDETFSVFGGSRTPMSFNATGQINLAGFESIINLNSESLVVDNTGARSEPECILSRQDYAGGMDRTWPHALLETWSRLTRGRLEIDPDYARRYWFFFYKKLPDGRMVSDANLTYSINVFATQRYLSLPADNS